MTKILRAYKTEIRPNNLQQTYCRRNFGSARFAFNWAIQKKKEAFEAKEKTPNNIELHRELNKLKGTEELHWGYADGISKCSFQEALRDCDKAFANFFRRCKQGVKGKKGFPKFKSKRNDKQSFRLTGTIKVFDSHIQIPKLGKVRLQESNYIPQDAKILSATVSYQAGKYFVSVQVEEEHTSKETKTENRVGVDLGIKRLATCSDGNWFDNPNPLKSNLKKLKRLARRFSRKVKGSKNKIKARQRLSRLHYKISNIRKNTLHKVTSRIINENQVIVLEDLKISNMMKNHCLARAISDVGFHEFRRQIEYKAKWNEREVIFADRFYPSSKLCSTCGWKNVNLNLSDRTFDCLDCGASIDRDYNASLNLLNYNTGSSPEIYASGDRSSSNESLVSLSLKEESNLKSHFRIL